MSKLSAADITYEQIVDDLAYRFDGVFSRESIRHAVADSRADLEPTATIEGFLPLLVQRFARERLLAAAQAQGHIAKEVPELLFVCVQNAGRSQMAAALANHLAPGKLHVRTAGSRPAAHINPDVVTVLAERGIELTEAFPKPLVNDVVRAADVIVTMGCGDTCPVYVGKHYEDWPVQGRVAALLRTLGI